MPKINHNITYHLLTADFLRYDFNKLLNEEKDCDSKILWKTGCEDGKRAQKYNIGDVCYIYYGNLPDGTSRILLRGEVVDSDTDKGKTEPTYSYDQKKKIKGIWLGNIKAIALDEPRKFDRDTLCNTYDLLNIQGQQYLKESFENEKKLICALEDNIKKRLKAVREYFDNYTRCFFAKNEPGRHVTFTSGRGLNYYEKHHFVFQNYINNAENRKWLLTDHNNLIHLCPICHRKIHHGSAVDVKNLIKKVYEANKTWYDDNLIKYANEDGFSCVKDWIIHIYDIERAKNNYQLISSIKE